MLVQNKKKQNGSANGTRVKVAVRCRPPFQDEIDFAKGDFFSIVDTKEEESNKNMLGRIGLTMISGKQRDFYFDYVFGESTAQDQVYDRLARPIVADVLKGCNGTIFAYGQTGTGKTYTMGILEFVRNEHAGVIPRAIAQIFDYVDHSEGKIDMTISLSFLQLYRETIQDLLVQASGNSSSSDDNLLIREDPIKGFYVEGLQEFVVRSYLEAEALINLGLENRAIAPTMMNSTSSRSHTVLTINIEQRVQGDQQHYTKTLRSKLLMVDLAGSERVRRTVSKGTRLSEAKSINTSLSALGNVIAALAESNSAHIPYRDSKLTRLLQDSLGGTAATALIATIGPAAINYGETLSTLLFAQRCMAVKVTPIPHEEVDYAEMCAKLQSQINDLQGSMSEKLIEQQEHYEKTILELQNQLEDERERLQQSSLVAMAPAGGMNLDAQQSIFQEELRVMMETIERLRDQDPVVTEVVEHSWFMKPNDWSAMENDYDRLPNGPLVSVLAFTYEILRSVYLHIRQVLRENQQRDDLARTEIVQLLQTEDSIRRDRLWEKAHMAREDPRFLDAQRQGKSKLEPIGSHLTPIQRYEAMQKIDQQFRSNNLPVSKYDRVPVVVSSNVEEDELHDPVIQLFKQRPTIFQYENLDHLLESMTMLHQQLTQDLLALNVLLARKDVHFKSMKDELATQVVDRRKREEEVVNWSYILKYLLKSASKLRKDLQSEKRANASSFPQQKNNNPRQQQQMTPGIVPSSNSSTSSSSDVSATPDTVNFLTNFLRHNPPSAGSGISGISGFVPSAGAGDTSSLSEDAFSETSESVMRDRTSTFDSSISSQAATPVGRPMSISHYPFSDGANNSNATTANSKGSSRSHASKTNPAGQQPEQQAYNDALQRVQLRANAKANTNHGYQSRTFPVEYDEEDEDLDSDYSSLPSNSSRSYHTATTNTTSNNSTRNSTNRPAVAAAVVPPLPPVLNASTVVTGKDGRPIIVTSPPQASNKNAAGRFNGSSSSGSSSNNSNYAGDFQPIDISRRAGGASSAAAPVNSSDQHAVGKALAKNRAKKEMAQSPSVFAQDVAKSLGVQGPQARDAMAIIDQIASISPEQLQQLDPATRKEILQLRQELGIDKFLKQQQQQPPMSSSSSSAGMAPSNMAGDDQWHQRASVAEQQHIERARAFSGTSSSTTSTTPSLLSASVRSNSSNANSVGNNLNTSVSSNNSRASSRGRNGQPVNMSPLRASAVGNEFMTGNNSANGQNTTGSSSRSSSRGRNGSNVMNNPSIVSQAEIRPPSTGRAGALSSSTSGSIGRNNNFGASSAGGSRNITPSQRSLSSQRSAGTANSSNHPASANGSQYLQQHNVAAQPSAFVNLADMRNAPSANTNNGSSRSSNSSRNMSNGGPKYINNSSNHGYNQHEDYDDDGYYSGVADSSISSRNSNSYFMQMPPAPPARPGSLAASTPLSAMTSSTAAMSAAQNRNPRASNYSNNNSNNRNSSRGRGGYTSESTRGSHYEDDDNDDEFSQLDSMG